MPRRDMQVLAPHSPRRQSSAAYQLTPVWERVVRTRRLPSEVDLVQVFEALRYRLRDPEREVRQHALRVLADLIPVVRPSLDTRISPLLPELLHNLGHPAPAVRQGALDALCVYLSYSDSKENVLTHICAECTGRNSLDDNVGEDVTTGLVIALPALLFSVLKYTTEPSRPISAVIKSLSSKLLQTLYQEAAVRSLLKVREAVGQKEFDIHVAKMDANVAENMRVLFAAYETPMVENTKTNSESIDQGVSETKISVGVDRSDHVPNGKVILETEFAFDSDTAITMTILEEDMKSQMAVESEDDSFDYTTYNKSLIKVMTDSEHDEYEGIKRTPRRVRFGGEIIKMRTPDSDNVPNSDPDEGGDDPQKAEDDKFESAQNGEENGSKRKVVRSMIPLPTLPIKSIPKPVKINDSSRIKSKSLNDLSEYAKVHFRSTPPKERVVYKSSKKQSDDDSTDNQNDEESRRKLRSPPILSPRRLLKKNFKDNLESRGYIVEDFSSSQSGNSSTGSGNSSDNAFEDFVHEDLGMMERDLFRDLFKVGDDRAIVQALERITKDVNTSTAAAYALEPQLNALAARLSTLGARGRTGVAAAGLLRAILRSVRPHALRMALPRIAVALAVQGSRGVTMTADLARRLSPEEIVDGLLNQNAQHWKSSKMRAAVLRVVSHLGKVSGTGGSVGGSIGSRASKAAASSCRHSRRRVRAAALDALASLAHLAAPRAVFAALHYEAADRNDADQLYDAVFARLCRSEAETRRPTGAYAGVVRGLRAPGGAESRPDLAWVMAGSNSASPPSVHKHGRKLETSWPRSAPDLPALVGTNRGVYSSYSAYRKPEHDKSERGIGGVVEARVVTAPATGVALRPLVLQPSPWPRQGLGWSHQPVPPWTHQQPVAWTSLSNSWNGTPPGGVVASVGGSGGGGSWPQRRPPAQLRALTPPPARPHLLPIISVQSNTSLDAEAATPSEGSIGTNSPMEMPRECEDINHRSPEGSIHEEIYSKNQQYNQELDETPSHKIEITAPNDDGTTLSYKSNMSNEGSRRLSVPQDSPLSQPKIVIQESVDEPDYEADVSPSHGSVDNPPVIEDDFDDVQTFSFDEHRIKTPSTTELRFVKSVERIDEIESIVLNEYNNEERFINMKLQTPSPISDKGVPITEKIILSDRSSARSTHSQMLPVAVREVENVRANLGSAPTIAFVENNVSNEEEIKSVESSSTDASLELKTKEIANNDNDIEDLPAFKISPAKKTPTKKTLPKALSSKLNRNKIQPIQETAVTVLPFEKPKEAMARCLHQLESSDWETVMTGLQSMSRLVRCHPALIESQLTTTVRAVAHQVKNLRSQVARAACRLAGEMFLAHRKGLEPEADDLALPLLHRTADTNKFLRTDANNALDKMCESIAPQKSISIIMMRGTVHQNAIVRCTSTRLLANIVNNAGSEKIFSIQKELRDKLFHTAADLLTEGSQETRGHAKRLFSVLAQSNLFTRVVREVIPLSKYRNIEKIINGLRTQ